MTRTRKVSASNVSPIEWFDGLRSDYDAAKDTRYKRRRTGLAHLGSNADYHYHNETAYFKVMEIARDIDRNDKVVGQGINRACANILLGGFDIDPQTGSDDADLILKDLWAEWCCDEERASSDGENTFRDLEMLALRQTIVDGDIFALPLSDGSLELVEAHRCRTPRRTTQNVVHGILMDGRRRRLQYWFTRQDIDPMRAVQRVGDMRQIPARDTAGRRLVFHLFNPRRISQTRGVTALAPVVDLTTMHDDIEFAKLVQQQVVSCWAILREKPLEMAGKSRNRPQIGQQTSSIREDGSTEVVEKIASGLEISALPGEKITGFSPNIPNPEWFKQSQMILTFMAINLDLPLQIFLLDATQTNFSGWRGAMDQAKLQWRQFQRRLAAKFHRRVWIWKVLQWMAENPVLERLAMQEGVNLLKHRVKFPRWPYIQPLDDVSADLLSLQNGMTSPRRVAEKNGDDFDEVFRESVDDRFALIDYAMARAVELNTKYPDVEPVHWQFLAGIPTPDGVQANISQALSLSRQPAGAMADED